MGVVRNESAILIYKRIVATRTGLLCNSKSQERGGGRSRGIRQMKGEGRGSVQKKEFRRFVQRWPRYKHFNLKKVFFGKIWAKKTILLENDERYGN